jgi:dienelactone hydrolase
MEDSMTQLALAGIATLLISTTAIAGEPVVYEVEGSPYEGYFAPADGESKGLVLIVHDWDGLDSYETGRADMLAAAGYDAFAVDLFGQGNRPETVEARQLPASRPMSRRWSWGTALAACLS